jgi:hypothetical protein
VPRCLQVDQSFRTSDVFTLLRDQFEVFHLHKPYFDPVADAANVAAWEALVGRERVLHLDQPKAVVDVVLGAIALVAGARSLDRYNDDLTRRGQDATRVAIVDKALGALAALAAKSNAAERKDEKAAAPPAAAAASATAAPALAKPASSSAAPGGPAFDSAPAAPGGPSANADATLRKQLEALRKAVK